MTLTWLARRRVWFALIAAVAIGLLAFALYLQHAVGLEPCPLCILQRYAFTLVALFALIATVLPGRWLTALAGGLTTLAAAAGAGVAGWHTWLQHFPPEVASCGPGLETMITELPLSTALPRIFQGSGNCTEVDWTMLGLSIAEWSLVWLLILLVASVIGLRRRA
jgi:disulfide bond formation protein DsbB